MQLLVRLGYGLADALDVRGPELRLRLDHLPHVLPGVLGSFLSAVTVEDTNVSLLPEFGYVPQRVVGTQADGDVVFHVTAAAGVRLRRDTDRNPVGRHLLVKYQG